MTIVIQCEHNPEYENANYEEHIIWHDGIQPSWYGPPRRFKTLDDAQSGTNPIPPYTLKRKIISSNNPLNQPNNNQ